MGRRNVVRLIAIGVLSGASLFLAATAGAALSGVLVGGGATSGGAQAHVTVRGASAASQNCGLSWHEQYTQYEGPKGPIDWKWHSTASCTMAATSLATQASLYYGTARAHAAPTRTCQNCASVTSRGVKSFPFNGAGSWSVKTTDSFVVPNIGTETANGTLVWFFSGGTGSCTEVNANEVLCATASNPLVVP